MQARATPAMQPQPRLVVEAPPCDESCGKACAGCGLFPFPAIFKFWRAFLPLFGAHTSPFPSPVSPQSSSRLCPHKTTRTSAMDTALPAPRVKRAVVLETKWRGDEHKGRSEPLAFRFTCSLLHGGANARGGDGKLSCRRCSALPLLLSPSNMKKESETRD